MSLHRIAAHRALLAAALCLATLGAPPLTAAELPRIVGEPYEGPRGVQETVSSIMLRQVSRPASRVLRDAEEELEQPDRRGLPQNPDSPPVASWVGDGGMGALGAPGAPGRLDGPDGAASGGTPAFTQVTVGTSFTGATLSGVNPTLAFPPDCMGAVGPTQYVVFVNGRLVTFNKATGLADGALNADPDVFFASVVNGSYTSDPRIRYDRFTGRWFLVIINVSTPNRILVAVSDAASGGTITPATVFTFFFINIATTPPAISSSCLADYPTLGLDVNALYVGTNNFCPNYGSSDGYVIRKTSILDAGPLVVTVFRGLVSSSTGAGPYTPQGVDNYDPAATEGYFIGVDNATFGTLMLRRVSNPGGTPSVSSNVPITVPATQFPILVNHLGNTGGNNGRLDALDDRLFAAHLRNGRLWTAHNIGVNNTGVASGTLTRDAARWYELNVPVGSGTPSIVQSGTVYTASATNGTDQRNYWIPSVMVSGQGHAALGFSTAGTNERANAAVTGRLAGDALAAMQAPTLYTSSATAYNPPSDPGGTGGRRWGDYSYTSLDPLDDMTMWTVQQFCDATNSYGVRVARLVAPPPATPATLADVTAGQSPITLTLTGTSTAGSGFYDPGANLPGVPAFQHLTAGVTNGSATGTPPTVVSATYVNPTTVQLVLDASAATANVGSERYLLTVTNPDGQAASAAVVHVVGGTPVATLGPAPSLAEGDAATTTCNFTVQLSAPAAEPVTIGYQTADGTAMAGDSDYLPASGSITIPTGQSSGVIPVQVVTDLMYESNETFLLTLNSATNATLGAPASRTATILNDDPVPTADLIPAMMQPEGNAGPTPVILAVNLTNPSAFPISLTYQSADGTATAADGDYTPAGGTLNIPPRGLSATFPVSIVGDTRYEADEEFTVALSAPTGCTIGQAGSTVILQNDDVPPVLSVDSIALPEGDGVPVAFTFTLSLSQPSGLPVSADVATADGTATLAHNDYVAFSGTVTVPPGAISVPVPVLVNGDAIQEPDEDFMVTLTNLMGAAPGTLVGAGTILNDDAVPTLAVNSVAQPEGNSGVSPLVFTVSLSNPADTPVTVDYQTADGSATVAGGDYQAVAGTLTIPAKAWAATLEVPVTGDACGEGEETFTLVLGNAAGALLGVATGTGTIQNDDDAEAPVVTVVYPNGGEVLQVGAPMDIVWSATDNGTITGVDIALSRDGGATFPELLASGLPNTGVFSWVPTAPGTPGPDGVIRVTASDAGCNRASDDSDIGFTVMEPSVAVRPGASVTAFALGTVRPNPSTATTRVEFQLPYEAEVRLSIHDLRGREVALLASGRTAPGVHQAAWNGRVGGAQAPAGVYFVRYQAAGKSFQKRLVRL